MGLPPTDAPMAIRALALVPGAVAAVAAVTMQTGAMREQRVFSLRLTEKSMALIAFALLIGGVAVPYLVYGVERF